MRILQVVHTSMQFEPPIIALGKVLAGRGHLVQCSGYLVAGIALEEELAEGYTVTRIERGCYAKAPRFIRGAFRLGRFWCGLVRLFRRFRPGALIVYSYETLPVAWALSRLYRLPLVYYCTEYSARPGWRQFVTGWGIPKAMERWFVRGCHRVVSVEENRAELQSKQWGRSVDQIILNSPLRDSAHETAARRAIQSCCNDGRIRCVYAGRISDSNCLDALLAAADRLPQMSIDFYGPVNDPFTKRWAALLNESIAASEDRVRYRQTLSYELLKTALLEYDVGLVFYDDRLENTRLASPAKIFEYMRSGLALLSTAQPLAASVIRQADCGFLVAPPDLAGIDEAVATLSASPERLRTLRCNSLNAFRDRYAYDEAVKPLVSFLEEDSTEAAL
jgi:glycosyltransferase involved in cell wall biosynthesis